MSDYPALHLKLEAVSGVQHCTVPVKRLIIAGWTGRDREAMEKHIIELEELGIARPASTPIFYRISNSRLTTASVIQVNGDDSSGEVEFVLTNLDDKVWIGAGSDHTDRKVEAYGVTVSKQMCDKPLAQTMWLLDDIVDHWDALVVRSHIDENGERTLYQDGNVDAMLSPMELLAEFEAQHGDKLNPGDFMFGGTLAAINGIRPADGMEIELHDPMTNKSIKHNYILDKLPVLG